MSPCGAPPAAAATTSLTKPGCGVDQLGQDGRGDDLGRQNMPR